jgi:hypothetical protein
MVCQAFLYIFLTFFKYFFNKNKGRKIALLYLVVYFPRKVAKTIAVIPQVVNAVILDCE